MIRNISRIKGFGVFDNYSKPAELLPFVDLNIVYGWNYSGKTTLSRLFHCLEAKKLHEDYPNASFTVEDGSGNHLSESNLHSDSSVVRVFNTDFIAQNLRWDGTAFNPILLLGEESIEIEKQIDHANELLVRCRSGFKRKRDAAQKIDDEIADKKTKVAKQIKTTLAIVEAFTATHLNALLSELAPSTTSDWLLPEDAVPEKLKLALASDKDRMERILKVSLSPAASSARDTCKTVLAKTPTFSSTIEHLRDHPEIANWVEGGLALHADATSCEFCGNQLDAQHMADLRAHFSRDLANFRAELQSAAHRITSAKIDMKQPEDHLFYSGLRPAARAANDSLAVAVTEFNAELEELAMAIERKKAAPFDVVDCPEISVEPEKAVAAAAFRLNDAIESHNATTDEYGQRKSEAIVALKRHYTAEFAAIELLDVVKATKARLLRQQQKYQSAGEAIKTTISELEAKINLAHKGREDINLCIGNLLGGSAVQIDVVNDGQLDRFRLVRGETVAKNLSEGEKTAIAFSFFLSKLKEEKNFENVIVYIDDPISSLDSNHIFQVNAIILDTFFRKEGKNWKLSCNQLFISTHNFEFLSLLKELPGDATKKHYYHTRRINLTKSALSVLPNSIIKFQSEYHYLFSVIKAFHDSDNKSDLDSLMSVPNAVRRFVELYTLARIPSKDGVDQRTAALFGAEKAKRVLKVLHYFSHLNNIERLAKNTDLVCDIENAVAELLELMKTTDARHLEALEASIAP